MAIPLTDHTFPAKCCVIMPTYNNANTLKRVIDGVLEFTQDLIIVNDGSTDLTYNILKGYPNLTILHSTKNHGKGHALKQGFKTAIALGFKNAITIDSDGQHFPKDIPVFIEHLTQAQDDSLLLIGARNMTQIGVPKKSSFGNKFSNFWYGVETGIWLEDTQSGFRLYPLQVLKNLKLHTDKFELEIEVIVKAAWFGATVKNIPINVLYDENERVSHFRPFQDFTRISILNTWLLLVAFFYIKPRDFYRKFKKKRFKEFIYEDILGHQDSPKKKALSIALGVFIGISPFWGFHTIGVIFLSIFFKLNKAISFACSNISLPPFIPFVFLASMNIGSFVLGQEDTYQLEHLTEGFGVLNHLQTYVIGSLILATVSAAVLGILGYFILYFLQPKKNRLKNE